MNGREATDTAPLADIFASPKSQLKSFVYMSCKTTADLSFAVTILHLTHPGVARRSRRRLQEIGRDAAL